MTVIELILSFFTIHNVGLTNRDSYQKHVHGVQYAR